MREKQRHRAHRRQSLMVRELAERFRESSDATSKKMVLLRNAGIVTQGRGRLYQIASQFLADKTERVLDFGYCLLRMNVGEKQQCRDSQTAPFSFLWSPHRLPMNSK